MQFDEYQAFTQTTAIYPQTLEDLQNVSNNNMVDWIALAYVVGKLNGEAGELAELHFKALRDEACYISEDRRELMRKELGDVLYYVARIAHHLDSSLDDIASENRDKLRDRLHRGVLQGSGDER